MTKQWMILPPEASHKVEALSHAFHLDPLVASILIRKGFNTPEQVHRFLHADLKDVRTPYLLRNMAEVTAVLQQHVINNQRIVILGDYDVDGITATSLMIEFLQACGCTNTDFFIPNRIEHGYGLTQASAEVLIQMKPDLVITVDNGITAKQEVQRLCKEGIHIMITDHHLPDLENIPDCLIVNPNHPECGYPFKQISGCGVALKLIMALRKSLRDISWWTASRPEPNLKQCMDLVALGTVADVVQLVDENRLFVQNGLEVMNQTPRIAIQALSRLKKTQNITSHTIGYQFAPLLNAAGRMKNASIAVHFLLCQQIKEAERIAAQLDGINQERRQKEAEMMELADEQAKSMKDRKSIIVTSPEFHEGISGIVAARLVERYYKPALVFAHNGETYKGSARSIPELHIKNALSQCADILERFGGHAGAAGCSIHQSQFSKFVEHFDEVCASMLPSTINPRLYLEGHLDQHHLTERFVEQVEQLQPFGEANRSPLFVFKTPQIPFQPLKEAHVKWRLNGNVEIIGWNLAVPFSQQLPEQLAVSLGFNEFRGVRSIQLMIEAYR